MAYIGVKYKQFWHNFFFMRHENISVWVSEIWTTYAMVKREMKNSKQGMQITITEKSCI